MTDDRPRKIWLQVYDQEGNYMAPEDRTFSANERVNSTDICYVRWGKTDILSIERDAALARAKAADARSEQFRTERDTWERLNDERYKELAQLRARVAELEAGAGFHSDWNTFDHLPHGGDTDRPQIHLRSWRLAAYVANAYHRP